MALFSHGRPKAPRWVRWICRFVILTVAFIVFAQDVWRPHIDNRRCERIATELSEQYGLVIRYGDPSEFYFPPKARCTDGTGLSVEPASTHSALIALKCTAMVQGSAL